MTASIGDLRYAQFTYACDVVRSLDPAATDTAIRRYLDEIDLMAQALAALELPVAAEPAHFDAAWPAGEDK